MPNGGERHLNEDKCWEFLRTRTIGRVAWHDEQSQELAVIAVDYRVDEAGLFIAPWPGTTLGREYDDREVAFQVDNYDDGNVSRWSVLINGRSRVVQLPDLETSVWLTRQIDVRTIIGIAGL